MYATKIIEKVGMQARVEWYYGNIYAKGEHPGPSDLLIPIHQCADAMRKQKRGYSGAKVSSNIFYLKGAMSL